MCCFFTTLILFGPRLALFIWWIFQPLRFNVAFNTFIWPLLGLIFLPWTTLLYLLLFAGGVTGFEWVILGLGLVADIASYSGGAWGNRERLGKYGTG